MIKVYSSKNTLQDRFKILDSVKADACHDDLGYFSVSGNEIRHMSTLTLTRLTQTLLTPELLYYWC